MKKNTKRLLLFSIIIVIIAIIIFIIVKNKSKDQNSNIITPIESHEITDSDIEELNNSEKAKVVIYWKLDDEKSLETLKLFNTFYSRYKDTINFIAVNNIDNSTKAAVYLNNNQINIPTATTANISEEIINEKEIQEFPSYLFLLKDGTQLDYTSKELTEDSLEAYLDILAENY